MNILLVNPYCLSDGVTPPLGLGFIAAAVKDLAQVTIKDFIKDASPGVHALEEVLRNNTYHIAGFKTLHSNYRLVKKYLEMIKAKFPHIITVVGGPQASILRAEMLALYKNMADFIIAGEGEKSFRDLCQVLEKYNYSMDKITPEDLSNISGLSTTVNGTQINNQIVNNNDISNFKIDWDAIQPDTYPPMPHAAFAKRFPVTSISVSRGCPYHCTFCASHKVHGRKIRYRSIDLVLDEIEYLINKYHMREIQIIDDNFTAKKSYVMAFCQKLLDRKLNILWTLPNGTRLDSLDNEMLDIMKASGLYSLSIGIESGSNRILKLMRKNLDLERARHQIRLIHKFGIRIAGFFIIGYYSETKEDILKTIQYALSVPLDRAQFMLFHPYPGTEAYETVKNHLKYDADTTFAEIAYVPETLTEKSLKNLQRYAFFRFYMRPRILYKLLADIFKMQGKIFIIKRIIRWLS